MDDLYDVTIIGAGAAGLFAANYAGMRGMKTKIIEFMPEVGGSIAVFYPDKNIYDIGGIPCISGVNLVKQLRDQALMHEPTLVLGRLVESVNRQEDGSYVLTTDKGEKHYSKTIILAAGIGVYRIRHMKVNGEILGESEHIHYEPSDLTRFYGKRVLVYGGLSMTVNNAIALSKIASEVTLVHHSDRFNILDSEKEALKKSTVKVKTPFNIGEVREDNGELKKVVLKSPKIDAEEEVEVDDLVISHGYNFDQEAVKNMGVTIESRKIPVGDDMATTLEGIYVAGDIAGYSNKWRLISAAFTEAITAVNSAKKYIDPSAPNQVYSSILMG